WRAGSVWGSSKHSCGTVGHAACRRSRAAALTWVKVPARARENDGFRCALPILRVAGSPIRRRVILEELPPHVLAGVEAVDDRVDDARGAVDDVERRVEAFLDHLARGDLGGILVGHPAG